MLRYSFFVVTCACCACFLPLVVTAWGEDVAPQGEQRIYIGTYTGEKSQGIYRSDLDLATGKLSEPVLAGESANPSFLAIHPDKKFLYAVNEAQEVDGKKQGGVVSFAIDAASGNLQLLNRQLSGGGAPCHLSLDRAGTHLLVANYSGGNAAVLPIGADGKLAEICGFTQHAPIVGSGGKKKLPLAHSINLDAAGRFAYVCDAGVDGVFIYRYDVERGTLVPNTPPVGEVPVDAAPRHFAFHPCGKYAYAINEAALSITVFEFNPHNGALTPTQTISTVPEGVDRTGFSTAEVVVHPSGKFVYGSNRGFDSIAAFQVNLENGQLTAIGQFAQGTMKVPRNFNIDPSGHYSLVAGQETDNIVVFKIDQQTGAWEPTGSTISVGKPVCIKFFPR